LPALLALLHPDHLPVLDSLWRLWRKGALNEEIDLQLVRSGQPDQWLCLTPHWRQDEQGHVWLGGTLHDISVNRRNKEYTEKFSSKKNTTLEILSHDLAGSFVLLQQLTEFVHEEMGPQTNPKVPEMLALMTRTSEEGVALIRSLVDQEFFESTEVPLKRERVDLRERIRQCLEPFQRAPKQDRRMLTCNLPEEPVYAEVDANKLSQVISNLVSNALKFTPEEGHIVVSLTPCSDCVRIEVTDEGIGIPEALQPKLFQRFTPAGRPGLRGEFSTGLGLSLCKFIVERHQGTISVASTEGKGSTFTIEIPISASPAS
jgi:two-component system sensor histidine kinase VicK